MSRRVDALRKREQATVRFAITAARAGEFIQFRISVNSADHWIRLTDAEWRQMREAGDAVTDGDAGA